MQLRVRRVYLSTPFSAAIAFLIGANFVCTVVECQFIDSMQNDDGSSTATGSTLEQLNTMFTLVFTAELAINMFCHWWRPFIVDPWNWLDVFIVTMSILSLIVTNQPTGIVRILRALRVIRLFGRVKSLKKIIQALSSSIVPVLNVFLILFLLMSIAAVMASSFFGSDAPHLFETFDKSLITLFAIAAGDSWPTDVPKIRDDG
mmetsp:Transcript_37891/g.100841  ORF Transcript_37891/g.100841 Transcript_37891/m.100841 type:complete len:203 (+) Transcript_37891:523-1131(+)